MSRSVLIFGSTGQVAQELRLRQPDAVFLSRSDADLSAPDGLEAAIAGHNPDLVINAAAYTAVDKAEEETELATTINGEAPGVMARACAARGIPFVHISTDYVFDGSGDTPWREDAPTAPINAYGASKLAGEAAVIAAGGSYAILRTAWVFSAHGGNFVKTMLRLAEGRDHLTIVNDQFGGPSWAGDIAAACLTAGTALAEGKGARGIYHFAGQPHVSWADFATEIFAQAGKSVTVEGIPATQFPTPAARPANSRLDCQKIADVFGVQTPDWREGLRQTLQSLGAV